MSVNYGGPPAGGMPYGGGGAGYAPPGKVNFGWISEAWQFLSGKAGVWILAVLLYGIVSNIVNALIIALFPNPAYIAPPGPFGNTTYRFGISYGTNSNVTAVGQIIGALFTWIFSSFQAASLYGMAVKQVRGGVISFADALAGGARFTQMLLLNLVMFFCYVAGIFAICLGALVVAAFLLPAQALVADGQPFSEALSASVNGMKRDWLTATLFVFVLGLLVIVSVIPCGLGLFVTVPMAYIIGALAYRDMIGMPGGAMPDGYGQSGYGAPASPGVWPPAPSVAPPPTDTPPASSYGQVPPPTSFGQTPPPASQTPPPAPSWGQPQPPANPPANPEPPRRSLGGDPIGETPPPGGGPQ